MALLAHRDGSNFDQSEIFELGSFITKGYGPKSAVDIDMFAGENQSVAYLSDVDMERIGINCGDYVFVRCVVEEEMTFFSMRKKLLLSIKIKRQSTL